MDHNWPYVAAGYVLCGGAIGGYVAWVTTHLRRSRRAENAETETVL